MRYILTKVVLALIILFCFVVAAVLVAGLFSEKSYSGSQSAVIHAPPDSVWNFVNDTRRYCSFRHEVSEVTFNTTAPVGYPRWTEHTNLSGTMSMEVVMQVPKKYLEVNMTRSSFGMSGTWRFYFIPASAGTHVLIAESSVAGGIIMRGILSFLGRSSNMKLQLKVIKAGLAHAY